jgi:hypothetical protein
VVKLALKVGVGAGLVVLGTQLREGGHERFRNVATAVRAEATVDIRQVGERSRHDVLAGRKSIGAYCKPSGGGVEVKAVELPTQRPRYSLLRVDFRRGEMPGVVILSRTQPRAGDFRKMNPFPGAIRLLPATC